MPYLQVSIRTREECVYGYSKERVVSDSIPLLFLVWVFFFHVKCSVSSALILLLDCSITILIAGEGKEVNSLCNQL